MKINRRGFLGWLGAAGVTLANQPIRALAAPLYIPSERLDLGVPHKVVQALVVPEQKPLHDLYPNESDFQPQWVMEETVWDDASRVYVPPDPSKIYLYGSFEGFTADDWPTADDSRPSVFYGEFMASLLKKKHGRVHIVKMESDRR